MRHLCLTIALGAALVARGTSDAMTMHVTDDQAKLSGPIVPQDAEAFAALIDANPHVRTIVLENSAGGSATANDAMTAVIEAHGFDTVVDGFCVSACAMVFLSGRNRYYGDGQRLDATSLGFHGAYRPSGTLAGDRRLSALKMRVLERTGGKIDPALVDRWLHFTDRQNTVRFRYPNRATGAPTTFFCSVGQDADRGNFGACDALPGIDALSSGITTSSDIVHVK